VASGAEKIKPSGDVFTQLEQKKRTSDKKIKEAKHQTKLR
jgi:hypothetical protein